MTPAPLTEAEQAAAEALATVLNRHERDAGNVDCWNAADFADEARAVVAAVRPILAKELVESAEIIREFAQSRPITSAEAKAIFDGIAASLSLPASKEQQ